METISELRKICQSTRPSIFKDFLSSFYYKISIYFTWILLLLRFSANQVTTLSGLVTIIGAFLIASNNKLMIVFGFSMFHLFAILDMSDGEVARYRQKGGMEGHYLDWYMGFIFSASLMFGLFIASYETINGNYLLLLIGLVAILVPLLDKLIMTSGWTVIVWTHLRNKNKEINVPYDLIESSNVKKSESLIYRRLKFIFFHIFMDHWAPLTLLFLSLIDYILFQLGIEFIDYIFYTLMYVGIFGTFNLYINVRDMILSTRLREAYNRLFYSKTPPIFPEDDFL